MRRVVVSLMVLSISTGAFAGSEARLPPGKPAGVRAAELHETENALLIGMSVVGAAAALYLMVNASKSTSSTATTTTTSP